MQTSLVRKLSTASWQQRSTAEQPNFHPSSTLLSGPGPKGTLHVYPAQPCLLHSSHASTPGPELCADIPYSMYTVNPWWHGNIHADSIFDIFCYCSLAPALIWLTSQRSSPGEFVQLTCLPCCRDKSFQAAAQTFQNNTTVSALAICPWNQITVILEKIILCLIFTIILIHSIFPLLIQRQHDRLDFSYISYRFQTQKNALSKPSKRL